MNDKKRAFVELLDNLTQCEIEKGPFPIAQVATELDERAREARPERLFRFRGTEHLDSEIDDMRHHRVFLSPASGFNDKLDAVLFIDEDEVLRQIREQCTPESATRRFAYFESFCDDEEQLAKMRSASSAALSNWEHSLSSYIDSVLSQSMEVRHKYRSTFRGACFTEELNSTKMWGTYGESGSGYAVAYATGDCDRVTCCCEDRCCTSGCQLLQFYPVIYDDQFDATGMASTLYHWWLWPPFPSSRDLLLQLNVLLHKTSDWEPEREWRIICSDCDEGPDVRRSPKMYASLSAKAVYLGYAMSDQNEAKLIEFSRESGVPLFRTQEKNARRGQAFEFVPVDVGADS